MFASPSKIRFSRATIKQTVYVSLNPEDHIQYTQQCVDLGSAQLYIVPRDLINTSFCRTMAKMCFQS